MDRLTPRGLELVRLVHAGPRRSRAEAAQRLGMGTGAASDLAAALAAARWLSEVEAPLTGGRGRPTKVFAAHPSGPLVLGAVLRHEDWQVDAFEIGGRAVASERGAHDRDPLGTLRGMTAAGESLRRQFGERVRGVGVAVPGPVRGGGSFTATGLDWPEIDLRSLWPDWAVPRVGNDATLAGLAESRRGASRDSSLSLHLLIDAGIGGGLVHAGAVVDGHRGVAGEFGHIPLGDPDVVCPCGLRGCWGTSVDGGALARLLGDGDPASPVAYANAVLDRARAGGSRERTAVESVARALGRGIGALVNALDPEVVTLGGLAQAIAGSEPDALRGAYSAGLMPVRREQAPPLLGAALGPSGPLIGAAEQAWDDVFDHAAG